MALDTSGNEGLVSPVPDKGFAISDPTLSSIQQAVPQWKQWLAALNQLQGPNNNIPFTNMMQQQTPNYNAGVPLYSMPQVAMPVDDQQKLTREGDIAQYASIIASLFGGGATSTGGAA